MPPAHARRPARNPPWARDIAMPSRPFAADANPFAPRLPSRRLRIPQHARDADVELAGHAAQDRRQIVLRERDAVADGGLQLATDAFADAGQRLRDRLAGDAEA